MNRISTDPAGLRPPGRRPRVLTLAAASLLIAPLIVALASPLAARLAPPESPHGKFRGECADCHSANAWKPARISTKFNHAKFGFPLEGAHAAASCTSCHASLDFTQEKQLCASCHEDVHRGELGTDCARCHTSRSFIDRSAMLRAHQASRFPLTGSHASLECEDCHKPAAAGHMQFVGQRADCSGCHMADFQAAKAPDHVAGGFPLDCMTCHSTGDWHRARFNHDFTGFPLTGAHRAVDCASCHPGNVFTARSTACASCHQSNYDQTTNPAHAASGFSTQCQTCHTTTSWAGATFNHSGFPLTGGHAGVPCASCHSGGVYQGLSTACVSCHQSNYDQTTNPPHAASGYSTQCQTCHTTTSWAGATFNHSGFPLTGGHAGLACASCHSSGVYQGLSTACVSCHQTDYNGTTNPAHAAAGFSTQCQTCHSTTSWAGATFDHDTNFFPIYSGRHAGLWSACTTCHTSSSSYTQFTCFSCHPHDDQAGTNSHHTGVSGYSYNSQACYSCHPRGNAGG
jgi:hypothetical protein